MTPVAQSARERSVAASPKYLRQSSKMGHMRGARAAALLLMVALLCGFPIPAHAADQVIETELMVPGTPEADGKPVKLDVTILTTDPATPRPAIVLAHGFGGTKADSEATARTSPVRLHGDHYTGALRRSGGRITWTIPRTRVRMLANWWISPPVVPRSPRRGTIL